MNTALKSVLKKILARISEPGDRLDALFTPDDVNSWPKDTIPTLLRLGLIKAALPAEQIVCRGCDERCLRPLVAVAGHSAALQSTCELYEAKGPFQHAPERLRQWTSSRQQLARFFGRIAGVDVKANDPQWRGTRFRPLRLGGGRHDLMIEFNGTATVSVGSASIEMIELLEWDHGGLGLDRDMLHACIEVTRVQGSGSKSYQSSNVVRDENKKLKLISYNRVQRRMDRLSRQHPTLNKDQLARKIIANGDGEGLSASRIARVTRKTARASSNSTNKIRRKNSAPTPNSN